jgi:hypothetical protein
MSPAPWRRALTGSSTPPLGERKLLEHLGAATLQAWDAQDLPLAHAAAAALLQYAEHTQGRQLSHIHSVRVQRDDELIALPASTRRNLELVKTLRGEDSPTLLSLLGHLHDRHGQPSAAHLAARTPARTDGGPPAPGRHHRPARRRQRHPGALAGAARTAQGA